MNPTLKKILQTALFVLCTLVVPSIILLLLVDSANNFGVYVTVYAVIVFAILGYIVVSVRSMSKEVYDAVEEMKMQNAAIAYKLTSGANETIVKEDSVEEKVEEKPKKVNLNPDDPLDFK